MFCHIVERFLRSWLSSRHPPPRSPHPPGLWGLIWEGNQYESRQLYSCNVRSIYYFFSYFPFIIRAFWVTLITISLMKNLPTFVKVKLGWRSSSDRITNALIRGFIYTCGSVVKVCVAVGVVFIVTPSQDRACLNTKRKYGGKLSNPTLRNVYFWESQACLENNAMLCTDVKIEFKVTSILIHINRLFQTFKLIL